MALKRKIDKATYDKLTDAVKAEYKAEGMDYVLDIEGYEDPAELKRAKDREAQGHKDEKARADKLEADLAAERAKNGDDDESKARKAGDIATLEKSWQSKVDTAKAEGKAKEDKLRAALQKRLVDGTAESIAKSISTTPNVLLPHIKARLVADFDGDEPVTRVLGVDGKVSALTLDELQKEFVANADFSAIITASNASGGGANGGKQGSGGATKKLADMTGAERAAFQKSDPAGFQREADALKSTTQSVKL